MESAEKPTKDLHLKASESLTKGGYPATPQSVNPNDDSLGESIQRDVRQLMGSALEKSLGGASSSVNDRSTKGRVVTLIGDLRRKLKAA